MDECIFCTIEESRIENENNFFVVIKDLYPVTDGHILIIPKRHIQSFFDLNKEEVGSLLLLLREQRNKLKDSNTDITGFNVGINAGASAGQTVFHVHVHLIPRRDGDVVDPRCSVRGVIPSKQRY